MAATNKNKLIAEQKQQFRHHIYVLNGKIEQALMKIPAWVSDCSHGRAVQYKSDVETVKRLATRDVPKQLTINQYQDQIKTRVGALRLVTEE